MVVPLVEEKSGKFKHQVRNESYWISQVCLMTPIFTVNVDKTSCGHILVICYNFKFGFLPYLLLHFGDILRNFWFAGKQHG
jgi:hypothetical protein